jgi:hypothetical protein
MEWLFLTCHNYWIVCRLVTHDAHPFLAYSQMISIKDSSEPFRAVLGAILSVVQGASVDSSTFSPDMQLDTIVEDVDVPENDIGDDSGAYRGSSGRGPLTARHRGHENTESELMVRPFLGRYL